MWKYSYFLPLDSYNETLNIKEIKYMNHGDRFLMNEYYPPCINI